MNDGGKRGFTLIELLVVIAIIAILAAILFPVFASVKGSAKRTQCLSNMAELGKAMQMYTGDTGGRLPFWFDHAKTWDTYIYKYLRNPRVFTCPINCVDANKHVYASNLIVRSYAIPKNVSGVLYEQAPRPTLTVLLLEKGSNVLGASSDAVAEWFTQTWGYNQEKSDKFWHGAGKNFAFCDGHTAYVKYPNGPFSYDFPSFSGWSGKPSTTNIGGRGYCGWVDNTGAGGYQDTDGTNMTGANIPR